MIVLVTSVFDGGQLSAHETQTMCILFVPASAIATTFFLSNDNGLPDKQADTRQRFPLTY